MREILEALEGKVCTFTAVFSVFSMTKGPGKKIHTWMLRDLTDEEGNLIADHIWIKRPVFSRNKKVYVGDTIRISARVYRYEKFFISTECLKVFDDLSLEDVQIISVMPGENHPSRKPRVIEPSYPKQKRKPEKLIPASKLFKKRYV